MGSRPSADNSPQKFLEALAAGKNVSIDPIQLHAALGQAFANFQKLTGMRPVDPSERMPLHCNAEYHFARFAGMGSGLVPLLYGISLRIAGVDGTFFLSMQKLKRFLKVTDDHQIYGAVDLLVRSGFWQLLEAVEGKPVKYRPLTHEQWAERYGKRWNLCTKKEEDFPFIDKDELAKLGRALHGILGGERFFTNVLKGYRKAANGKSDEQIIESAKKFMLEDGGNGDGIERRKRFHSYLVSLE